MLIGSGWNGMTAILGSGDVNFDGPADLMARSRDGKLWLFPGTGASNGRLGTARQVGSGWGAFTAITVTEVVNQRPAVWVRSSTGVLGYYEMYADGSFSPNGQYQLGGGWNALRPQLLTSDSGSPPRPPHHEPFDHDNPGIQP